MAYETNPILDSIPFSPNFLLSEECFFADPRASWPLLADKSNNSVYIDKVLWLFTEGYREDRRQFLRWPLSLETLLSLACQRLGCNFTLAEWQHFFPGQTYYHTCPKRPLHTIYMESLLAEADEVAASGQIGTTLQQYALVFNLQPPPGMNIFQATDRMLAKALHKSRRSLAAGAKPSLPPSASICCKSCCPPVML